MSDDRHGRHRAPDRDPRRRPSEGFRTTGRERFERLVADALSTLPPPALRRLREVRTVIEEVPREGEGNVLARWDDVVVASLDGTDVTRTGDETTVLRLYRRPIERRAEDTSDIVEIVREVVADQLDDRFGSGS